MKITKNLHPAGPVSNLIFGLAELADGLVRVVTLGHYNTDLLLSYSRYMSRKALRALKALSQVKQNKP